MRRRSRRPKHGTAAGYHQLCPGYGVDQLRRLEVGDMVVEGVQGEWVPARLIGCSATDGEEHIWRCCMSYHQGV